MHSRRHFRIRRKRFGWAVLRTFLAFSLLCSATVNAQELPALEGWTSHSWDISDGLPDQSIEAVAQTPDGYLWLGTPHGLARYDGFEFETMADKTNGILQEFGVSCLLVARDGALWVGSIGGGITRISHNQMGLRYEPGSEGLTVRALYQDGTGTIWAATGHGLFWLKNDRFVPFAALTDQVLTSISSDGSGGMWLAGARLFHISKGVVVNVPLPYGDVDEVIHGVALTEGGHLWIGTPHGLYKRDQHGTFLRIPEIAGHVRAVYTDVHGMLWVATSEQGLFVRDSAGRFVRAAVLDQVMNKAIRTIVQTSNGDVWAGTTGGLIRMSPSGMNLYAISTAAGADFGSIFIDSGNTVWLGAGTLTRFKDGLQAPAQLPLKPKAPIRAFFRDSKGASWIGTVGDGCYRIFQNNVQHFRVEQLIRGFLEGKDGAIWIATDAGMARWKNGVFETFRGSAPAFSGAVRAMALRSDGSIWVGTAEGFYQIENGRVSEPDLAHFFRHQRIWALHQGANDTLWIGAESGLYIWRDHRLTHISIGDQPAAAQPILSILEDAKNRILLALPGTVLRLRREAVTQAVSNATRIPGNSIFEGRMIEAAEFFGVAKETGAELYGTIPSAAQADSLGGAWYASYVGLIHIGADSISRNLPPPPLVIKQVLVDGISVPFDKPLRLAAGAKTIQIRSSPILLSSRPGLQLQSRLVGWEGSWSPQSSIAVSSYNELAPGRYLYRLEAGWANSTLHSVVELEISKEGPYYHRPLFIVSMLLLTALLLWTATWLRYRLKVHELRLQFQAVNTERGRVAREIHDTLLQGCIAVYSLLETYLSIRQPSGENEEDEDSEKYLLNHAREQIVETIADARTAIWNVRHAESGKPLNEVLRELMARVLGPTGIMSSFDDLREEIILSPAVQYEIMMAVRECLINAVSHGDPTHISIKLRRMASRELSIQVVDDGRGFDPSSEHNSLSKHFGLAGLRERIESLGGSTEIDSMPGQGATVTVRIPEQPIGRK